VAVIADLTKGTGRFNLTLGAVSTAVAIGAALSQVIAGSLVHHVGARVGFLFLAGIAAIAFAALYFFMPEARRTIVSDMSGTLRTAVTLAIFTGMLALIVARPRRWNEAWWTTLAAAALLAIGLVTPREALDVALAAKNVLLFLLSLLMLSLLVGKSGFFDWAAIHGARQAKGDAHALYRNAFVIGAIVTASPRCPLDTWESSDLPSPLETTSSTPRRTGVSRSKRPGRGTRQDAR
jgi:MFS family permease